VQTYMGICRQNSQWDQISLTPEAKRNLYLVVELCAEYLTLTYVLLPVFSLYYKFQGQFVRDVHCHNLFII